MQDNNQDKNIEIDIRRLFHRVDWKKSWTRKYKPPWLNKNHFKSRDDQIWITADNEILPLCMAETEHLFNIGSIIEKNVQEVFTLRLQEIMNALSRVSALPKSKQKKEEMDLKTERDVISNIFGTSAFNNTTGLVKYSSELIVKYNVVRQELIRRNVINTNNETMMWAKRRFIDRKVK